MRKTAVILAVLAAVGCARVNLQTSKPIKVDINMRVDVYQHVSKEAASIEDQVFGSSEKKLNAIFSLENLYAQDYSAELNPAIERRKARSAKIEEYFGKGYIGEDKDALVEIVDTGIAGALKDEVAGAVAQENQDRDIIYHATAQNNGADISNVRKVFFEDHYKRAPSGYWFQVYDQSQGRYNWAKK